MKEKSLIGLMDNITFDFSLVDEIFGVLIGFSIYKVFIDSPQLYSLEDQGKFVIVAFFIISFAVTTLGIFSVGVNLVKNEKLGVIAIFVLMFFIGIISLVFILDATKAMRTDNFISVRLSLIYATLVWMTFKMVGITYEIVLPKLGNSFFSTIDDISASIRKISMKLKQNQTEINEVIDNLDHFDISLGPPL